MSERIIFNEMTYFGAEALKDLSLNIKKHNFQRIFIITSQEDLKSGAAKKITSMLAKSRIVYQVYDKIGLSASSSDVKAITESYNNFRADLIIAAGSLAVMDAAKASSVILANPEIKDIRKIEGIAETKNPAVPLYVVTTRPGNARDFTYVCVIEDETQRRKIVCYDPHALPRIVFCDSQIFCSYSSKAFALHGISVLAAAIEGYISKNANQISDLSNLEAIKIIGANLKNAVKGNSKAKEQILAAQFFAGVGSSNSGRGLVGAMADSLEATNSISSVLTSCLLLPKVMEFCASSTGSKYKDIAVALGAKVPSTAKPDAFRKTAINTVCKLLKEMDIPQNAGIQQMSKDELDFLAESVLKDSFASASPKTATKKKITDLYKSIF